MDDTTPTFTELEVITGETSKLDDTATVLNTGLDFSPVAVATEDTTPPLTVPEEAATVEGCSDTLVDDWIVAFFETAKLEDTATGLDTEGDSDWLVAFWEAARLDPAPTDVLMEVSTSTTTELEVGTGDVCRRTLPDGSRANVFTPETV